MWQVFRFEEHPTETVRLPNGSHFKRVDRVLVAECETYSEAMAVQPKPGEGYLVTQLAEGISRSARLCRL